MKSNTNHVTNTMNIPVYGDIFNTYNSQLRELDPCYRFDFDSVCLLSCSHETESITDVFDTVFQCIYTVKYLYLENRLS